ncbi:MAG: hypothetical protein GY869_26980, partial [Planctomycetes bacterium]|nr:hypothetical protein [Planctomycetota bacterium]
MDKNTYVKFAALVLVGLICSFACQKTVTNQSPEVTVKIDGRPIAENSFSGNSQNQPDVYNQGSTINDPGPRYGSSLQDTANFGGDEGTSDSPQVRRNNDSAGPRQVGRKRVRAQYIADGARLTALTDDGKSSAVAWAYHGDKIAFVREIAGSTQKKLLVMNADGTGEEEVTPIGNPFFVQWSWAGNKLSYEFSNAADKESQGGVYIYDVATKKSLSVSVPYPRG